MLLFGIGAAAVMSSALVIALLILLAQSNHADFAWHTWETHITVLEDGNLHVTEVLEPSFTDTPIGQITRTISLQGAKAVSIISLEELATERVAYLIGDSLGAYQVEQSAQRVQVSWRFPPTSNQTRRFALTYIVERAFEFAPQSDSMHWQVITKQAAPIDSVLVQIHLPSSDAQPEVSVKGSSLEVAFDEASDVLTLTNAETLNGRAYVDLEIRLPHGLITAPPDAPESDLIWWERADTALRVGSVTYLAALCLGSLGIVALFIFALAGRATGWVWRAGGRDWAGQVRQQEIGWAHGREDLSRSNPPRLPPYNP